MRSLELAKLKESSLLQSSQTNSIKHNRKTSRDYKSAQYVQVSYNTLLFRFKPTCSNFEFNFCRLSLISGTRPWLCKNAALYKARA
jgi:hypothetical protein